MRTSPGGGHGSEGWDDLELRSADPFDAGGAAPYVHAVTKQAATADDLVDEALDDEAVVVGTSGPIR